jgi:hypothetical protein
MAQSLDVVQRLLGCGILEQVLAEDEIVGGVADSVLLSVQQLARTQVIEEPNNSPVGLYTFRAHGALSSWSEIFMPPMMDASAAEAFSHLAKDPNRCLSLQQGDPRGYRAATPAQLFMQ